MFIVASAAAEFFFVSFFSVCAERKDPCVAEGVVVKRTSVADSRKRVYFFPVDSVGRDKRPAVLHACGRAVGSAKNHFVFLFFCARCRVSDDTPGVGLERRVVEREDGVSSWDYIK